MNEAELVKAALEIQDLAGLVLDPAGFLSRVAELRRGGLPAQSIPEGSRSTDAKLPLPDKVDRELDTNRQAFVRGIGDALKALRQAEGAQRDVMGVMGVELPSRDDPAYGKAMRDARSAAAEEMVDGEQGEHRFQCLWCEETFKRTKTQRPRAGLCRDCYDYRQAHPELDALPEHVKELRVRRILAAQERAG